jgi:hypothetical protein
MRFILLLVALCMLGLLIHQQMGRMVSSPGQYSDPSADLPRLLLDAGELSAFEDELKSHIDSSAEKRRQRLEERFQGE